MAEHETDKSGANVTEENRQELLSLSKKRGRTGRQRCNTTSDIDKNRDREIDIDIDIEIRCPKT